MRSGGLLIGAGGVVVALLWLFVIYPPRRTAEGPDDNAVRREAPKENVIDTPQVLVKLVQPTRGA